MSSFISPFIYYIVLYAIIWVTNYFRILSEEHNKRAKEEKPTWKRYFFISNEIIYTASGVYILLLANHDWVAPIMVSLILLLIISLNMVMMGNLFSETKRFIAHMIIIVIIITATFSTFYSNVEPPIKKTQTQDLRKIYKVAFSYKDLSIDQVLENEKIKKIIRLVYGPVKYNDSFFLYQTVISATNDSAAVQIAKSTFMNDTLIEPKFNIKGLNKRQLLSIYQNTISSREIK